MAAPGATDLDEILRAFEVTRRPGRFRYLDRPATAPAPAAFVAMIDEGEHRSYVVADDGDADFPAAWLTVDVATSLDAIGLTALMATALAAAGIPANVLAGFRHDHLLVPEAEADAALAVLRALRRAG